MADSGNERRIGMFDVIRNTVPLEGYDDENILRQIPVGSEGTVLEIYGDGEAFEVEFSKIEGPALPPTFNGVLLSVDADQCDLVWKYPRNNEPQD